MGDINRQGDIDVNIVDKTSQDAAGVTSENRLKVDAKITDNIASLRKGTFISLHLKLNGTGTTDLSVDGSTTPQHFYLTPPSGKKWYISRMLIAIEDASINHLKFGGISGGLTNGVEFKAKESGTEIYVYEYGVKKNSEFYHMAYDVQIAAAGTDILSVRFSFFKSGTWLELKNSTSDFVKCIVNDDLTPINEFEVVIQGFEVTE